MSAISQQDVANLQRQIRSASLYNRQLASICQVNGLKSTGVKAELQSRILNCTLNLPTKQLMLSCICMLARYLSVAF